MSKGISFDEMLERVASSGEEERIIIEEVEELVNIIDSISSARIAAGMTQRQLAEKCGIKQSAIARIETLQVTPRIDTLIKIARSLDLTIKFEEKAEETMAFSDNIVPLFNYTDSSMNNYSWNNQGALMNVEGVRYGSAG